MSLKYIYDSLIINYITWTLFRFETAQRNLEKSLFWFDNNELLILKYAQLEKLS